MRGDQPVVSAASLIVSPSFTKAEPYHKRVKVGPVEENRFSTRFCCGMRTLLAVLALTLAIPATASADTVGTATTSSGQTLTVTIDSPADGATLPSIVFDMTGHATLSAAADGGPSTAIDRVEPGLGDGYGEP